MKKLRISDELQLPIEAVTEVSAYLGRRGSGKTYAAQKAAEEMHRVGAQFVVLDPVGVWYGLRLAEDGKKPGLPIPVFGGLHGDVPLEPGAGKIIADLIVDRTLSCVIDVSQFESDADKARFAADFAARFFFRKKAAPSAVHIFVEEAQEFVPQNPQRDEAKMLHHWTRIVKIGRNFGIGISLISLRPQEVNKKVLNLAELLFAFQMTGPQERKTIQGWIQEKGLDEDFYGDLPKLKRGQPHMWSPSWLEISRVVPIAKKWTFDASGTPTVGARAVATTLGSIDIAELGEQIKATIEKAKADDPKELKRKIAELERRIRQGEGTAAAPAKAQKPVVDHAAIERAIATTVAGERKKLRPVLVRLQKLSTSLSEIPLAIGELAKLADAPAPQISAPAPRGPASAAQAFFESDRRRGQQSAAAPEYSGDVALSGTQRRMLAALAGFAALGHEESSRAAVAGYCAISHTTGSYSNNLSALRTAGLIEDGSDGYVRLTAAGHAAAGAVDAPVSLDELHRAWFGKLSGTQARMLEVIVAAYPDAISRRLIAETIGVQADTGSYSNNLSKMRTLGLITDKSRTEVVATELLFPPGLA